MYLTPKENNLGLVAHFLPLQLSVHFHTYLKLTQIQTVDEV
jgi:hypothetical protein